LNASDILAFFTILQEANPKPKTELLYASNFELLCAVILSAQATDISVNKATKTLFKEASSPQKMLALGLSNIERHIKTIGLYRSKAKYLMATCHILEDRFGGKIPETRESLESLPGVGRKTANVVLNTAFGHATMGVDTHIFRLSNRTGMATGTTPLIVEKKLLKRIPKIFHQNAHHWLILLGRYICTARAPKCTTCHVARYCDYARQNLKK
jgi:endonuclease III